jgi:hypothetical protein
MSQLCDCRSASQSLVTFLFQLMTSQKQILLAPTSAGIHCSPLPHPPTYLGVIVIPRQPSRRPFPHVTKPSPLLSPPTGQSSVINTLSYGCCSQSHPLPSHLIQSQSQSPPCSSRAYMTLASTIVPWAPPFFLTGHKLLCLQQPSYQRSFLQMSTGST